MALRTCAYLGALLAGAVALAQAQQAPPFFQRLDRNGDGVLTKDEFPPRFRSDFDQMDANHDGKVTAEEAVAFMRSRRRGRPARPGRRQPLPPPDYRDVRYGPYAADVLDLWKAQSDKPTPLLVFFHGGGFRGGDKSSLSAALLRLCLEAGISVAAANYRLSGEAPYPAAMLDSARAIQFLRSKASQWNIDPKRIAAYGGSAGAGISLWLAFHDDLADPTSEDPVARQSTRLTCAVAMAAQSTYDPRQIKQIVPGNAYQDGALKQFYGLPRNWNWDTAQIDDALDAKLKDASPLTHLGPDDPPVFLYYRKAQETPGNIHHPNFGRRLKEEMEKLGIECVLKMDTDYSGPQGVWPDVVSFLKKHFKLADQ